MKAEPRFFPDLDGMSRWAADFVADAARSSVHQRGFFTMVLSGGSTPRKLYSLLASSPHVESLPWDRMHLFQGDERLVPPDHPHSNFRVAYELLISHVKIPSSNVHRMPTEIRPAARAAAEYEGALREFFRRKALQGGEGDPPPFDLILLGIGPDGHTASLFPGDPSMEGKTGWIAAVNGTYGDPPIPRLTMTLPLINGARCVIMLVAGAEKKYVIRSILMEPEEAARKYPAGKINPRGRYLILHDYPELARI